jgi:hypothetical protein
VLQSSKKKVIVTNEQHHQKPNGKGTHRSIVGGSVVLSPQKKSQNLLKMNLKKVIESNVESNKN